MSACRVILLTGATGYVGGRLLHELERRGERVRCLARRPEAVRPLSTETEVRGGDVLDGESLHAALASVDTTYYLVHALGDKRGFEEADRQSAATFARAAREGGVGRIVYLGGLGDDEQLSAHLASRQKVGRILRESGVPTLELRASIVIGSGSLSVELVRALVERLPVMVTPRWVRMVAQPIAIEDLIAYLLESLDVELPASEVVEIGGGDRVSYRQLMEEYAHLRGLRRLMVPVPLLTSRLSSLGLGLVTPVYARVGRKLVESLPHETVVRSSRAQELFSIEPRGYREAIARALANEDREIAQARWSDALSSGGGERRARLRRFGGRLVDSRAVHVPVSPNGVFAPVRRIGGRTG